MKKLLVGILFASLLATLASLWLTQGQTGGYATLQPTAGADAPVGGNFRLIDQNGKPVSDADFHGRLMLVFFGYTHCPDVCPLTIGSFSAMLTALGAQADQLAPLFITVDPARDTPTVLKDFLANADPRITGLTGTPEQVRQVAQAYKAYFAVTPAAGGAEYTVDHSAFIYLMGRDGSYIRLFSYDATPAELADGLKPYLN